VTEEGNSEESEKAFRDGKAHLQEGAQKILEGGIAKGREQRENIGYYRRNQDEILEDLGFTRQKEPAVEGLIVLLPILIVGLVVAWLFQKIELIPYNEVLNFTEYYVLNQSVKLSALLVLGAALSTAIGKLTRTRTGFELEKIVDNIIGSIPFLGGIYRITKVTTETVIEGTEELSKPVKIELNNVKLTAFKTGNVSPEGREILFLPTSPNIPTGLILEVKPEHIIETDETAEEALTRTLSAGFGQNSFN